MFQSNIIKTDVSALKIIQNEGLILAGIGGYLHVFNINNAECLNKYEVFQGENICNIVPNKNHHIIVVSGLSVKILDINNFLVINETAVCRFPDWILAVEWVHQNNKIAAVFMHNKVQLWNRQLEVECEIACEESCILYSAHIYNEISELFIFSGTVFSDILIWKLTKNKSQSCILKKLKGHKGVIFSLDYNPDAGFLCSTSDDRTAFLWKLDKQQFEAEDFRKLQLPAIKVSGHLSRIFRCKVLNNCFLTAGEDSTVNIWSLSGKLERKIETHQGAPVWCLDYYYKNNLLVTGGGDCGIAAFPLDIKFHEDRLKLPNDETPKTIGILRSKNMVAFSEIGTLWYLSQLQKKWIIIEQHDDLKNYVLLQISKCQKLVSLSGINGQLYIYVEEEKKKLKLISYYQTPVKSRIFSFHWLTCQTFIICQEHGLLTLFYLKNNFIIPISKFVLPQSKERWTTTALTVNDFIIVGDRKGHIHLFDVHQKYPIQTLKRVHNYLGVTNLLVQNKFIISLGRDGTIKTFAFQNDNLRLISSDKLKFSWLLNIHDDLLIAFSSSNFLIWHLKTKRILFEKDCGGGHRSWDFIKNSDDLIFTYIKDKIVNRMDFKLSTIVPLDYLQGYHSKEINDVKVLQCRNSHILISGGEDTLLRLDHVKDSTFENLLKLKSHLSSIRAIAIYSVDVDRDKEVYLMCSAGGRAQIICWKLDILLKTDSFHDIQCSEQHSYYKVIDSVESEMRIMDLIITKINSTVVLFCACSDGIIKVFYIGVNKNGIYTLSLCRDIFYKLKCIMKLACFEIFDKCVLVSLATDGKLVFWDMSNILTDDKEILPIGSIQANQSGINSCSYKLIDESKCFILTGGDDNSIIGNLIEFNYDYGRLYVRELDRFVDFRAHCAQITGIFLSDKYFITVSIDQRINIFSWTLLNNKTLSYKWLSKYDTSISDIHGLQCFRRQDKFNLFVYGNGMEFLEIV